MWNSRGAVDRRTIGCQSIRLLISEQGRTLTMGYMSERVEGFGEAAPLLKALTTRTLRANCFAGPSLVAVMVRRRDEFRID
jgi:hypothetical protein